MLTLRPSVWIAVLGTILLLVFVVCGFVYNDRIEAWYWRTQVAPALERDLGFTSQLETRQGFAGTALVIESVVPGREFYRAGLRSGDRPWDYHGREEVEFFRRLESARGGPTTVAVVRPGGSTAPKGDMGLIMKFDVRVPAK